jgi:hypothetical protein
MKRAPEPSGPGLNVNVAAPLLGQFGNDNFNVEQARARRIEQDQSNATPIRFSLRQIVHGVGLRLRIESGPPQNCESGTSLAPAGIK